MVEKRLTPVARKLRRASTEAERRLWIHLRGAQLDDVKFVRQFIIGGYIADFACRSARLVVELDGSQHADSAADEVRTATIEAHGYRVMRFWNNEVLANTEGVLRMIAEELRITRGHQSPLPRGDRVG